MISWNLCNDCGIRAFGTRMGPTIDSPGHGNNIVYGINTTEKWYLKGKMEPVGH